MNFLPGYTQGSNIFQEPVVPPMSGYQFVKIAGVAFIAIWLLKGLGKAFKGG